MKKKLLSTAAFIAGLAISFSACNKDEVTQDDTKYTSLNLPSTPYTYNSPFASDEMIALGRVLFYDGRLSENSSISCATCHKQVMGFSDDAKVSLGFRNKLTDRNTLAIQNLNQTGFNDGGFGFTHLFWDGRETNLNTMVVKPILNHVEMGMNDEAAIVSKVKTAAYYPELFKDAFGTENIDIHKVGTALAAFTGSITSQSTLFDKRQRGEATFNAQQQLGEELFFTKYNCNSCHQTQELNGYQSGGSFSNIGLDANYTDNGLGAFTKNPADNGMFKIPNLRNIALTAPYMHDGRFETLEEVVDHYSHGIQSHPNLDIRLQDPQGAAIVLNITEKEKEALVAFMGTLTDYSMITDPRFASPFK